MPVYPPASVPTTEEEIWRYSRIDELQPADFAPSPVTATVTGWTPVPIDPTDVLEAPTDVFAELNAALSEPVVLHIPAGRTVTDPIEVIWAAPPDGAAHFPRLIVETGPDSEVTVVERFVSDDVHALVVPVTQLRAGPGARLRYLAVNELGRRVWQIGHQVGRAEQESDTLLATVALGGYYARVRTDARLDGAGATGRQIAAYYSDGDQMHDFRTLQDHAAPKTTSDLLFKGAVQDRARSVYTGLIRVRKSAPGTNAFQTNRNLKLSEGAWADSVPNLEIENNDVRCSHASAVGPIDADQRFYLESRGVPPATAERLIVLGFFDEVLDQLPAPHLVPGLRRVISAKLDSRTDA
jgi:Fe-S cluster assembly protein SufD